jgi:secreted trypsin-like serine protease
VADGKVVGIFSWDSVPCADGFPDVYARISSFAKWINENKL